MINEQEINLFAFLFPRSWLETTKKTRRGVRFQSWSVCQAIADWNNLGLGGQVIYVCYQKVTTEHELTNHPQRPSNGRFRQNPDRRFGKFQFSKCVRRKVGLHCDAISNPCLLIDAAWNGLATGFKMEPVGQLSSTFISCLLKSLEICQQSDPQRNPATYAMMSGSTVMISAEVSFNVRTRRRVL